MNVTGNTPRTDAASRTIPKPQWSPVNVTGNTWVDVELPTVPVHCRNGAR